MISAGDKIILLVSGPHGVGLVRATIDYIYESSPAFAASYIPLSGHIMACKEASEGVTWIHGHDLDSPAARALLVAGTLGR